MQQRPFQLPPLLAQVAGPVGGDPVAEPGHRLVQRPPGVGGDHLGARAGTGRRRACVPPRRPCRRAGRRSPAAPTGGPGRQVVGDAAPGSAAGGSSGGSQSAKVTPPRGEVSSVTAVDRQAGQPRRPPSPGRPRSPRPARTPAYAAEAGALPAQPAQHVRHVRAEHPPVGVALVDHHVRQPAQERRPAARARAGCRGAACPGWSARTGSAGGSTPARRAGCPRRSWRGVPRPAPGRRRRAAGRRRAPWSAPGRARWPGGRRAGWPAPGSWYARDLPDAVPVATTTCCPSYASSAASAWCRQGATTPRRGERRPQLRRAPSAARAPARPARAGTRSTWVTGSAACRGAQPAQQLGRAVRHRLPGPADTVAAGFTSCTLALVFGAEQSGRGYGEAAPVTAAAGPAGWLDAQESLRLCARRTDGAVAGDPHRGRAHGARGRR